MGPRHRTCLIAAALAVIAVGCSGDDAADGGAGSTATSVATSASPATTAVSATAAPSSTGAPTPADGTLFPAGDVDAGLQPWIELATADLAGRLAIDPVAIEPVSAVLVAWPDVALGCPEPGRQYATIITDGAVIELSADGEVYRYHAGGSETPFLCATPITTAPARL